MKNIIIILFLMSSKLTFGQIINGGFEIWDTTYTNIYSEALNTSFGVPNPYGGIVDQWTYAGNGFGISQTTDSYSGNYSLILHNWYNYANQSISYLHSISSRPLFLQGYFKYIKGESYHLAHGKATVTLTRFNGVTNDTIAKGALQFDSTPTYTPFQLSLNYLSPLEPDTINIYIVNSDKNSGFSILTGVNNLLYLDDLTLSHSPLALENLNSTKSPPTVYPNPADSELKINVHRNNKLDIEIFNIFGQLIMKAINIKNTIDISQLVKGIYFIKIRNRLDFYSQKFVKQ